MNDNQTALWARTLTTIRDCIVLLGTKTWGDVGRSMGLMFLQSLIQVGLQMLAQKLIMAGLTAWHGTQEITKTSMTAAGETTRTGITAAGSGARSVIHLGETVFHGIQVGLRVAAHLAGELMQTVVTLVQTGLRKAAIIGEAAVYLIKAALAALAALASIPIVGPILAIAAMAAILKAGYGVLTGHADGGFTADGPRDRPAGIVHAGEWVAPQWMVNDPTYGSIIGRMESARTGATIDNYTVAAPTSRGGLLGARGGGASGGLASAVARPMRYIHVRAPDMVGARQMARDSEFDNVMIDWSRRNRGEIAAFG